MAARTLRIYSGVKASAPRLAVVRRHRGGRRWTCIDDAPARGNADDSQDVAAHTGARAQSPQGAAPVMATLESAPAEHEALRHAALCASREERSDAPELARRYAELCARKFAPPAPLLWPRRTGGRALRIVVLAGASLPHGIETTLAMIAALPRERFEVVFAGIGGSAFRAGLPNGFPSSPAVMAIPASPGADDAKRLAALDPDVLIDLAGLDADVGPLLAQRPGACHRQPCRSRLAQRGAAHRRRSAGGGARGLVAGAVACAAVRGRRPARAGHGGALDRRRARASARRLARRASEVRAGASSCSPDMRRGTTSWASCCATPAILPRHGRASPRPLPPLQRSSTREWPLAKAAQATGDVTGAIAACTDGLALVAAPLPLYRALGLALLAANDAPRAVEAFATALALDSEDGETHYNHGVALQILRQWRGGCRRVPARACASARPRRRRIQPRRRCIRNRARRTPRSPPTSACSRGILPTSRRTRTWARCCSPPDESTRGSRISIASRRIARPRSRSPSRRWKCCQHRGDFAALDRYLDGLRHERFRPRTELELVDCLEQLLYLLLFFDVEPALVLRYAQIVRSRGAERLRPAARAARGCAGPARCASAICPPICAIT